VADMAGQDGENADLLGPIKIMMDDVVQESGKKLLGTKESHS
jgi:hypothetical protein